jgi:hypothetical protein
LFKPWYNLVFNAKEKSMTQTTISMQAVQSTSIAAIGYKRRTMNVEFNTGRIYEFTRVPRAQFDQFRQSLSKGQFFNQNIKDLYPSIELV